MSQDLKKKQVKETLNNLRDDCLRFGLGDLILVLLLQIEIEVVALAVLEYRAKPLNFLELRNCRITHVLMSTSKMSYKRMIFACLIDF